MAAATAPQPWKLWHAGYCAGRYGAGKTLDLVGRQREYQLIDPQGADHLPRRTERLFAGERENIVLRVKTAEALTPLSKKRRIVRFSGSQRFRERGPGFDCPGDVD